MSNLDARPVGTPCTPATPHGSAAVLLEPREVPLGGIRGLHVSRTLPQRDLSMVGPWCFLDQMGPATAPMRVLPHPHTGLQTVTWPLEGEIRHRDSLGSDVILRPGELNLMTSGQGIAHSEVSLDHSPVVHGLQLWIALPADVSSPGFEQHTLLPVLERRGARATVVVGTLGDTTSPATTFSPVVGADVAIEPTGTGRAAVLPLRAEHEHAVLVLSGTCAVDGVSVSSGPLLYLGTGRDHLRIETATGARLFLVGGEPFPDDLVMWWNFVGRSHEEIVAAREAWEALEPRQSRYGTVPGHGTDRIPAPPLPDVRLAPRRRRNISGEQA